MASKPAARAGDPTAHGGTLDPGEGVATVNINGKPAWVALAMHACPVHGLEGCPAGSETVNIGNRRATGCGDYLLGAGPPDRIMDGSPDVNIGSPAHGIATPDKLARFCAAYCSLKKDWPALSPSERRERYQALLADMFAGFGAPAPGVTLDAAPGTAASFDYKSWTVKLPPGAFEGAAPPRGSTTFHELRHGEQVFTALRSTIASDPQTAAELEGWAVPPEVADAALNYPVDPRSAEGRRGRVMASQLFSPEGVKDLKEVSRRIEATAASGDAEGNQAAWQAYQDRPLGDDAAAVEHLGDCGGC